MAPVRINTATGLVDGIHFLPSPHFNQRPEGTEVDLLVIHGITQPVGHFGGDGIDRLFCPVEGDDVELKVSAHLLIRRDGSMTQYVSFNDRAWHAGLSSYEGREDCNDFSIGIELEGTDELPYEGAQYAALIDMTAALIVAYPKMSPQRIAGHSDIAPGRKTDPGPSFDWNRYRVGLQAVLV